MDDIITIPPTSKHVLAQMGSITIVDNKGLNWADETPDQGRSCANCYHYGIYKDPASDGEDPDGLPFYARELRFRGYCTESINSGLFVVNVPNNKRCHRHQMRHDQFNDDALDESTQGGEV